MSDGDPILNPAGTTQPSPTAIIESDIQHKEIVRQDDSCADNDLTCSEYLSLASDNPTLETASAATSNDQNDSDCSEFQDAREGGKENGYSVHSTRSSFSSVVDGFLDECMNKIEQHESNNYNLVKTEEPSDLPQNVVHEENVNNYHEELEDNMEKTEEPSVSLQKRLHEESIHNDQVNPKNTTEKMQDLTEPLENTEFKENINDSHDSPKESVNNIEKVLEPLQNSELKQNICNDQDSPENNMNKAEDILEPLEKFKENICNDQDIPKNNMNIKKDQLQLVQYCELNETIRNFHKSPTNYLNNKEDLLDPLEMSELKENVCDVQDSPKNNEEDESEPLQTSEVVENVYNDHDSPNNNMNKKDDVLGPLQYSEPKENLCNDHDIEQNNMNKIENLSEPLQNSELKEIIHTIQDSPEINMNKIENLSEPLQNSELKEIIYNNQDTPEINMNKRDVSEPIRYNEPKENISIDHDSENNNMNDAEYPSAPLEISEQDENIISNDCEGFKNNIEKIEEPSKAPEISEHEENVNIDKERLNGNIEKTEEPSEPLEDFEHVENVNNNYPTVQEDSDVEAETHLADEVKEEEKTIKSEEAPVENLLGAPTILDDHQEKPEGGVNSMELSAGTNLNRGPEETDMESKETTCSHQKYSSGPEQSNMMDDKQTENKSSQFQLDMEKEGFSLGCNLSLTTVFDEKGLAISENEKICEIREIVSKLEMPHVLEKNLNLKMDPNEMANTITNNIIAKIGTKKSQTSIIADNNLIKENLECTQLDKVVESKEQDLETSVPDRDDVFEKPPSERASPEKEQVEQEEPPAAETIEEHTEIQKPEVTDTLDDFATLHQVTELCNYLVNTVAGPMTSEEMKLYKTFSDVKPQRSSEDDDVFSPVIPSPPYIYQSELAEGAREESPMESNGKVILEGEKSLVAGEDNAHTLLNTQSTDRTELSQKDSEIPRLEVKKDEASEETTELSVQEGIPDSSPSEGQPVDAEENKVQEQCTLSTANPDKDAPQHTQGEPQGELEVQAEKSEKMEKTSPKPKRSDSIIKMVEKTEQADSGIQSSITYKKVVRSNRIPVLKAESPTRMKPTAPKPTGCSENANRSLVQSATLLSLKERIDAVRNKRNELSPKPKQGKGEEEKAERKPNASPTRKDKENGAEDLNEETTEQAKIEGTSAEMDTKELRNEEIECLEEDEAEEDLDNNENSMVSCSVKSMKASSESRPYKKSQPSLPPGKLSALMTRYRTQLKRYNTHLADFEAYQARIKTARENLRIIQGQMIASSGDGPEGFTIPELPPNVICNPIAPTESVKLLESENKKLKESMHKKAEELFLQKEKVAMLKSDVKTLEEKVAIYESGVEKPKVEETEKHTRFQAQMSRLKQRLDDEMTEKSSLEKKKNSEVISLSNKIKYEIAKREQLQKSLVQKAEEIDRILIEVKELKSEKDTLQATLNEQSLVLEKLKKKSEKLSEEMTAKDDKMTTIENCLQEERKLNNDLRVRLENSEKERAESCQRIMQLSDVLVDKGDQIEENSELLSKEHIRNNKLAELFRHLCGCVGCDLEPETLCILMNSDVESQENIVNKIKMDVENVHNERKEELLRKEEIISSLRAEMKDRQKLVDELLEFADVKNAGVYKKTDDEDGVQTTFTHEPANMEKSLIISHSKDIQSVNTQELVELLETKRHAMQRMEKQIKDLQDLHSYCGMRRTLQESKIAELELTLAGYLD